MKVNRAYLPFYEVDARYNIIYGGAGSAKSYEFAQWAVLELFKEKTKLVITRKIKDTLRESVFSLFCEVIENEGLSPLVKINKQHMDITFMNGSKVISCGWDDPDKIKSINGVDWILFEEADQCDEEDFKQADLRIRGLAGRKKKIIFIFNPIDETHWLKTTFFDTKVNDCYILHTTYKDNAFLDEAYKATLEALKIKDEYFYNVYCLGKWGSINNARVFNNFRIEEFEPLKDIEIYQGMDFGFNDPTAFERFYIYDNVLYIFDEYYNSGKTLEDIKTDFKDRPEIKRGLTIGDSSDPSKIESLRRDGWNIRPSEKGADSVISGIDYMKSFNAIVIHPKCSGIAKEFKVYKWTETKTGILRDKPVDAFNHGIDAVRYGLELRRKNWKYKPSLSLAGVRGI